MIAVDGTASGVSPRKRVSLVRRAVCLDPCNTVTGATFPSHELAEQKGNHAPVTVFVLRLASAALLILLTIAHVVAQQNRSKNYYGLTTAKSQSVCQTVLASLNKEYSFSTEQLSVQTNPHLVGDFLLTADIQVQWRRNATTDAMDAIDYADADLMDTGKQNIGVHP